MSRACCAHIRAISLEGIRAYQGKVQRKKTAAIIFRGTHRRRQRLFVNNLGVATLRLAFFVFVFLVFQWVNFAAKKLCSVTTSTPSFSRTHVPLPSPHAHVPLPSFMYHVPLSPSRARAPLPSSHTHVSPPFSLCLADVEGGSGHECVGSGAKRFGEVEPVQGSRGAVAVARGNVGEAAWFPAVLCPTEAVPRSRDASGPSHLPAHAARGKIGLELRTIQSGVVERRAVIDLVWFGWFAGWLADWLADWFVDSLIGLIG